MLIYILTTIATFCCGSAYFLSKELKKYTDIGTLEEFKNLKNNIGINFPCRIGDTVLYQDEQTSYEFIVEKFVIDSSDIKIYGYGKGCVTYVGDFNKYCKIINMRF